MAASKTTMAAYEVLVETFGDKPFKECEYSLQPLCTLQTLERNKLIRKVYLPRVVQNWNNIDDFLEYVNDYLVGEDLWGMDGHFERINNTIEYIVMVKHYEVIR